MIKELFKENELADILLKHNFECDTVHRFQGDEKDIMIFSPVISKGFSAGLSFLKNNGNLFNVAITRARAQLIVIGDSIECSKSNVEYLVNFSKYVLSLEDKKESDKVIHDKPVDSGPKYPEVHNPENVSLWEIYFYEELYKRGIKTIPQYQVEKYSLDLAIIKGEKKLDIEIDGQKYHQNWDGELCRRDMIRNNRMQELGWDVKRFWVYQVRDNLDECIDSINTWINEN